MLAELMAGMGVLNGAMSLFEKDQAYQERKKLKERYAKSLQDMLITPNEANTRLDSVADMFNPAIMQDLNAGAVRNSISGVLNPVAYSNLIPQKQNALVQERQAIDNTNREIHSKIAETELMDMPRPGFGDFLSGGIEGAAFGARVQGMMDTNEYNQKMLDKFDPNFGEDRISGLFGSDDVSDYLGKMLNTNTKTTKFGLKGYDF